MIIYDMEDTYMTKREKPKAFLPVKNYFKKLSNRFFAPKERDRNSLDDNLEYYLALQDFKDFVEDEVLKTEQFLLEKFAEENLETIYLEEIGLKVKLLKEHGTVFMVNEMSQADVFEARRQKKRRNLKK